MPSPVVDSSVNNALLLTNPDLSQSLLEFVYIFERRLIDSLLYDSPKLVIDRIEVSSVGGRRSGEMNSGVSLCSCASALSC